MQVKIVSGVQDPTLKKMAIQYHASNILETIGGVMQKISSLHTIGELSEMIWHGKLKIKI